MENSLTFDLENWYDSEFIKDKKGKDFVLEGLNKAVHLLKKYNVKATFFVTGDVLSKYPAEIKKLAMEGHEIASHSYEHKMISKISKEEAQKNIIKSKNLIKKVIGKNPKGFRAPSWSIRKEDFWIYDFLDKNGFEYSSSLFPISIGYYGDFSFPTRSFKPIKNRKIIEIPATVYEFFKLRIPFAGGVYFRILPRFIIEYFIKKMNERSKPVVLIIHPWEFCPNIPRANAGIVGNVVSYYGLKTTMKKLDYLLSKFKFVPLEKIKHT